MMSEYNLLLQLFLMIYIVKGTKLSDWVYLGCFKDYSITRSRVLKEELYESDNNTRKKCIQDCFDKRYKFSGTENGDECWCGNEMTSSENKSDSECDHKCSGNEREYCGGNWRISIYNITRRYEVSSTTNDQTTEAITSAVSVNQSTPTSVHTSSSSPDVLITSSATVIITDDQKSEKSERNAGDQKRSWTALYVSVPAVVIAVVVAVSVLALLKRRSSFRRKQRALAPKVIYSTTCTAELLYENSAVRESNHVQETENASAGQDTEKVNVQPDTSQAVAESEYNVLSLKASNIPVPDNMYDHMTAEDRSLMDKTYSSLSGDQRENILKPVCDTYSHFEKSSNN